MKKLNFSLKRYFSEIEKVLSQSKKKDWYHKGKGKQDILNSSYLFAKELELRRFYYPIWLNRFQNKVPATWEYWRNIYNDLDKASKSGFILSTTTVDAAVTHPLFVVARKAGLTHRLTRRQLSWLFSRPYFIEHTTLSDEITKKQTTLGASTSDLKFAISTGNRVRQKLASWYKRNNFPQTSEKDEIEEQIVNLPILGKLSALSGITATILADNEELVEYIENIISTLT